ncbi:MAG: peptide deformylase, partial [Candidatus Omnitrophota bacterium]
VRKVPDPVLRLKAAPVGKITEDDLKLVRDMFDTMYYANGVGLAAPQVGVSKRIIVCNPTGEKADEFALIDPVILYRKGSRVKDCEGCLSIPGTTSEVTRSSIVGVSGRDLEGREITVEARLLMARIIDHECDHLEGKLFIDRISLLKRKLLMGRYKRRLKIRCVGKWY